MSFIPTIIIVSDPHLKTELAATLPYGRCKIVHCASVNEALNHSADAAVAIIDGGTPHAEVFCQRLRQDPLTASVVLIMRMAYVPTTPTCADVVVDHDISQTVNALYAYLPEMVGQAVAPAGENLPPDELSDDEGFFDIDESTVVWRPDSVDDWPQPPPVRKPTEDMLEFTRGYAGYVNSLIEAYATPEVYSATQMNAVNGMSGLVVKGMDEVLATIQQEINAALKSADLQRMRELSSAKNICFEKLNQLKTLSKSPTGTGIGQPAIRSNTGMGQPAVQPKTPMPNAMQTPHPGEQLTGPMPGMMQTPHPGQQLTGPLPNPAMDPNFSVGSGIYDSVSPRATGPLPQQSPNFETKSTLTLAAEKKEAERRKKEIVAAKAASAKKAGKRRGSDSFLRSRSFWLVLTAVIVIAAGGTYLIKFSGSSGGGKKVDHSGNRPPAMSSVTIQETPSGIFARPDAKDPENDRIGFSIRWYVNKQPVSGAYSTRLAKKFYRRGQSVEVEVTPNDPFNRGTPMRSKPLIVTGRGSSR